MDQPQFHHDHHDHRKPDRVIAVAHNDRQKYRNRHQNHADAFQKAAQNDVDHHDQHHHAPTRQIERLRDVQQHMRQPRLHHEVGKHRCADHDHEQHGAGDRGGSDRFQQLAQRYPAARHANHDGAKGADRGSLVRAENPGIDAADGDSEQHHELPRVAQRAQPCAKAGRLVGRNLARHPRCNHHCHHDIKQHQHDARQQCRREQLAYRLLGNGTVNDRDDRGRNQNAKAAARRDGRGRVAIFIARFAHFGQRDAGHGGGGGDR